MFPRNPAKVSAAFLPSTDKYLEHANDYAKLMATPGSGKVSSRPQSAARSTGHNVGERIVPTCASPLFTGLTSKEYEEIASCAHARTFTRNEVLFMQGQPVNCLVLIKTGSVKLTQVSASGKEVVLWMNGSGDAMGMPADSPSSIHTCSARALEQCKALIWEYSRLQMLVAQYPQLRKNMTQILMSRIQELEERFCEIATEKVAKRLALALSRLVKQVGKETGDGIEISLSREELAQLTGTTLFTISRNLSKWAEMGVLVPRRESVLVLDPKRLEFIGCEED